jgi:hypothetical protein
MRIPRSLRGALLVLALGNMSAAQVMRSDSTGNRPVSGPGEQRLLEADTVVSAPPAVKSPGTAVLLSAVLPGAGQAYNESYWKVPVVIGFGVYFGIEWAANNSQYKSYRDQYAASITPENPSGDQNLFALREFYKDNRDSYTLYLFILYMLNLLDAYVDASLYGFDVGADLSFRSLPVPGGMPVPAVRLQFRLP